MRSMRFSSAFALATLLAAWLALGPAALAQDAPFQAMVTSDKVNVRSGSSQNYYSVIQLNKGDVVQVHENIYGWYRITPPPGSFSYIAKEFVKPEADGKTGVVTGERVRVRAPSPAGPDQSYKTQVMLDKNAKVAILGEEGQYYKIAPPAEASLFISQEFLAKASPQQIEAYKTKLAAATAPKEPEAPKIAQAPVTPNAGGGSSVPLTATDSPASKEAPKPSEAPAMPKPAEPNAKDQAPTELPKANTHPAVEVALQEDGSVKIDNQSFDSAGYDQQLKKLLDKDPDTAVVVKGDAKVGIEHLSRIVDQTRAAGVRHVSMASKEAPAVPVQTADKPKMPAEAEVKPVVVKSTGEKYRDLEERFADSAKKPLAEQPVAALRMEYEQLLSAEDLSAADRQMIKHRLELLQTRQQLQESVTAIDTLKQQMADSQKRREETDARKPKAYTAVGRLISSSLYTGEKLPRLYRLIDPLSGLTIAYVQTPGVESTIHGQVNSMLGQYVGLIGAKQYDPALKLNVILVKEIDALTPVQQP